MERKRCQRKYFLYAVSVLLLVCFVISVPAMEAVESPVEEGGSSDFLKRYVSYTTEGIQYQAAHEEELSLEADAIAAHPVSHYPVWMKWTETVEGPENSGKISFADRDLNAAQLEFYINQSPYAAKRSLNILPYGWQR